MDIRNRLMTGLFKAELYVTKKKKQPKPKQQQKQHKTNKKGKITTLHIKSQQSIYAEMLQNKEQGTINLFIVHSSPKLNPLLRDTVVEII